MSTMSDMIRVANLGIGFDGQFLMRDLNFEVKRGEVFVILGGSGSGKTTLLKAMIGLLEPLSGEVSIEGLGAPALGSGAPQ